MRKIERIFIHCTASSQTWGVNELLQEFKRKGWKNPGYHYVITSDGIVHQLIGEERVSNGVKGYNHSAINVAYVGGIDSYGKTIDNRNDLQKASLIALIKLLHKRYPKAKILGHRDASPDINHNGIVDPWERIKECPCFNAISEYKNIQNS
jgi:N-acetylmuramoyl-L-alanine amidase